MVTDRAGVGWYDKRARDVRVYRGFAKATSSSTMVWWLDWYEQLLGRTSGLLVRLPPP